MCLFPSEFLNCSSFILCTTLCTWEVFSERKKKVRERKESKEEDREERRKDKWNKMEWKGAKWKEIGALQRLCSGAGVARFKSWCRYHVRAV